MKDLYYVLMYNQLGNARQCKTFIKHGKIIVNNEIIYDPLYKVKDDDCIIFENKTLHAQPFLYYMVNKPKGYICANYDKKEKCVVDLIDEKDCYCLGRLDKDTTGLLILTNDKSLKKLLLPQNHIQKTYLVETLNPLNKENSIQFQQGIIIDKNRQCLPALLEIIDDYHCLVTIEEGKYHQIKKMFLSINNQVVSLKRIAFGSLSLDNQLEEGQIRSLTNSEKNQLLNFNKKKK